MQSRGGRTNLITSAQGKRVSSRVDNSLGRIKQQQINQSKQDPKGGTHYGNMFSENQLLINDQPENLKYEYTKNNLKNYNQLGKIGIQKQSRKRISTDSMKNSIQNPQTLGAMVEHQNNSNSMLRRNSQNMEQEDKTMNIINIDD